MSKRRCRLCSNFTVEGSIFCDNHRHQAQLFARSFGGDASPAPGEPAPLPEASAIGAEAQAPGALAHVVHAAFERALARAQGDTRRWAQISLYFIDDKMIGRPYFSVVPPGSVHELELSADVVRKALEARSPVMVELGSLFDACHEQLRTRQIQSLDLHLLTYAKLLAINENTRAKIKTLAVFDLGSGEPERVQLDAVKERIQHDRWS